MNSYQPRAPRSTFRVPHYTSRKRSKYFKLPRRLLLLGILLMACMVLPLVMLIWQVVFYADRTLWETIGQWQILALLGNTFGLALGVWGVTLGLAFPLAWLTTKTDMPFKKTLTLTSILPLAMPGYVMAYSLLAIGGNYGAFAQIFGISFPRLSGYFGALWALSLHLFPYMFLNLRTAILGLDPSLEESARSLGLSFRQTFWQIILPQLRPAILAGTLLILLHVLGDFGVVSLMRYKTFSFALYLAHNAFDKTAATWFALVMLSITILLLLGEARLLKGLPTSVSSKTKRNIRIHEAGYWKWIGLVFCIVIVIVAFIAPLGSIFYWLIKRFDASIYTDLWESLIASSSVALPVAIISAFLALLPAYNMLRYPSWISNYLGRMTYLGYAIPPLALALALIAFSLQVVPFLYQSYALLIFACCLHFLAEALAPVRSALYQAPAKLEEVAQSLGFTRFKAFFLVTLPLLKRGLLTAMAFVFLSTMKELPLTFILAPIGFETLAFNVWSYTNNANFGASAPFSLAIVVFSAAFVWLTTVNSEQ